MGFFSLRHAKSKDDSPFIVRPYYQEIDRKMDGLKEPTVWDALKEMAGKGNAVFFDKWQHLEGRLRTFPQGKSLPAVFHGATHLILKIAHTPEQEYLHVPFRAAFDPQSFSPDGHYSKDAVKAVMDRDYEAYYLVVNDYFRNKRDPNNLPHPTRHEQAVIFAAGVYMRNKLALCQSLDLHSYQQLDEFAAAYARPESDAAVKPTSKPLPYSAPDLIHKDLPYRVIGISPDEWHCIVAVATGLAAAADTPYPARMQEVSQAIHEAGLSYTFRQRIADAPAGTGEQARV